MSTTHKEARESSRPPLVEYTEDAHNHPTQTAGTKRLFSNRGSRLSISSEDYGENHNPQVHEGEIHSGKRQRASDWPLCNTGSVNQHHQPRSPLRNRNTPNSPSNRRPSSSQIRPSKFVEGSMNDRASQMPPPTYLGEEELRERYEREEKTRGSKLAGHRKSNTSITGSTTNQSEASRHSSIFRFGKSLAATFNPSNWKIWSKQQEEEETAQHRMLRERQEKAEKIYKELKRTGHFRDSTVPPNFGIPEVSTPAKHDSGAAFRQSSETIRDEKRMGRVFLEPPPFKSGESPASNAGSVAQSSASARKNGFHFKKPSLSNMRKAQGSDSGSVATEHDDYHQPRRVPSRKDMQKQQKLVKRVSDLEGKLEAARRQLSQALGEPVPKTTSQARTGRPRFVPGALSTLPSERLLSGYVSSDIDAGMSDVDAFSQIGRAVTTDHGKEIMAGAKLGSHELHGDPPSPSSVQKNKPLPKAPETPSQGRVMESVESDEAIGVQSAIAPAAPLQDQVAGEGDEVDEVSDLDSSLAPVKSESEYRQPASDRAESESELSDELEFVIQDPVKEPVKKRIHNPAPKKSKKRKSTFEREGDNSGTYHPPPASESSAYIEVKKPKSAPKKTTATTARPRKLQKTVQDQLPVPSGPPVEIASPQRPRAKGTPIKKPASAVSRSSSRLTKSKTPHPQENIRQSASPPPSSLFQGLDYAKPSSRLGKAKKEQTEPMYSAIPSTEGSVPPMPKLPNMVRLPSGEVIHTAPSCSNLKAGTRQAEQQDTHSEVTELQEKLTAQQALLTSSQNPQLKKRMEDTIKKVRTELQAKKASIRLGDGVAVGGASGNGGAKLQKARPQSESRAKGGMERENSFEWDKDVF